MTRKHFKQHYAGEWIGVASARDEDVVPALLSILRHLYEDHELTDKQADEWREFETRWDAFQQSGAYIWDSEETLWLEDLVREALPDFADMDMSLQWADRGCFLYIIGEEDDV